VARREYPGVYPYPVAGGRTLYRTLFRDSDGRPRQKRGFTSPTAAARYRAKMIERADRGELRATRERFGEHFDRWLRGHHSIDKVIRVYRQRTSDGADDHTKSRRFRAVSVGDRLLALLRDLYARQSELYARDLTRTHVFVMPVRRHKNDRGRWESAVPQAGRHLASGRRRARRSARPRTGGSWTSAGSGIFARVPGRSHVAGPLPRTAGNKCRRLKPRLPPAAREGASS
jgi:hypothetical protein